MPSLGRKYTLAQVSGDSPKKDFFAKLVQEWDVIICTAQILYNALTKMDETQQADLSGQLRLPSHPCGGFTFRGKRSVN